MISLAQISIAQWLVVIVAVTVVLASAWIYWRRQLGRDSVLVLLAGLFFVLLVLNPEFPTTGNTTYQIDTHNIAATNSVLNLSTMANEAKSASTLLVKGHGLRANQWQDMPSRRLQWDQKDLDKNTLRLYFPTRLSHGRIFSLQAQRSHVQSTWRLILLAENGQVLMQVEGQGDTLSLNWLPPLAERLVLKARVETGEGKLIDQGTIPVDVIERAPLRVYARFATPSFDVQSLRALLKDSHAIIDSQVAIGKNLSRVDEPSEVSKDANLLLVDAAYLEQIDVHTRQQLMQRITLGTPLLILAANARHPPFWQREFGLSLATDTNEEKWQVNSTIQLSRVPLNLKKGGGQIWRNDDAHPWISQRDWGKGKIVWLAASDWHRYQINAPHELASWWQQTLDRTGVEVMQSWRLDSDELMPMAGQRLRVCAQGLDQQLVYFGQDQNAVHLHAMEDQLEQRCTAYVPQHSGWLEWRAESATQQVAAVGAIYVYPDKDWSQWQNTLKQDATQDYALRIAVARERPTETLPRWTLVLLIMACMLALWFREQH